VKSRSRAVLATVAICAGLLISSLAHSQTADFPCRATHTRQSIHNTDSSGVTKWTATWAGDNCSVDLRAEGKLSFTPDTTQIKSISPGGYFDLIVREGTSARHIMIQPAADGSLKYEFSIDNQTQPFDATAQAWLASLLLAMERQTGMNASARVPYLVQQGGPDAVLNEISNLGGDYVRAVYLLKLFDAARLNATQVQRTLRDAAPQIHSDYELARVLIALGNNYPLADDATRMMYVQTADHLKSDYEHARVLIELVKRPNLSNEVAVSALQSANNIHSDYEHARVLLELLGRANLTKELATAAVQGTNNIHSDYEHARVLIELLKRANLPADWAAAALDSASKIQSDYEKARVLKTFVGAKLLTPPLHAAYFRAAGAIKSDYERARTLIAALDSGALDGNGIKALLDAVAGMHSDHEITNVLLAVAGRVKLEGAARNQYIATAEQIHSEYDRNRALAAVVRRASL
jgi:ribosome-binding factor A